MSIKVDNNRLEVLLNEYNNHANELAYFLSPTEISYKNNEEIINNVSNLNVLVGLELSTYLNIIIISNGYFYDNELNKNNAQLICNTHDTNLLNLDIFRRDEIWFTERNNNTATTEMYALSDFSPRKDENIEKAYLLGRYGGIPFIKEG